MDKSRQRNKADSRTQSRGASDSNTSESELTTSVEANKTALKRTMEQGSPQSESSSTTLPSISRSSADISSEILADASHHQSADHHHYNHRQHHKQEAPPASMSSTNRVHGHLLPSGWSCKYFPNTDEYSFEYSQDTSPVSPTKAQTITALPANKTPTRDDTVQTSRRATLHMFECNYGYHFPTSPTSSMISELARQVQKSSAPGGGGGAGGAAGVAAGAQRTASRVRQIGYGKHKLLVPSDEDEQARRLRDMFPTATQPVVEQMIRIYHGREGLIKAALISLGYKRATEYSVQQASAQSPIMLMMSKPASKKLFDKLISYFPDKDESLIKNLMYKHKEVEHEIISALVEAGPDGSSRIDPVTRSHIDRYTRLSDRSAVIMKLRYLKFLYPTCEEIELYHLLNCNDLNAQRVMELLEKRGHKRINIEEELQKRKSQTQQMRAQQAALAAKDKPATCASELVEAHVKRTKPSVVDARRNNLLANLRRAYEDLDESLLLDALEAADFSESLARRFIDERAPIDESLYKQRYQLPVETEPDVVVYPCKAIQKGDTNFMSIMANESVSIERRHVECENALALLKVDASTFTQDDFLAEKFTHRQVNRTSLGQGPKARHHHATSHRESLRVGAKYALRCGSNYEQICNDHETRPRPNSKATGHRESLSKGRDLSLVCGHNSNLVRRTHPFFVAAESVR